MKTVLRWLFTTFMVASGVSHFRAPEAYAAIVPSVFPSPAGLVFITGVAEVLGGLGLIPTRTRRLAAWGVIELLIAVFPANVKMAVERLPLGRLRLPGWALFARLPLQALLVAWAFWYTRADP